MSKPCEAYQKAKEAGEKHYFTGRPCRRGHMSKRYTSSKQCFECQKVRVRKYMRTDKAKKIATKARLERVYGVPSELILSVDNCQICSRPLTSGCGSSSRCADHDHSTGHFRGVLCGNCNKALGLLGDDVMVLQSAIDYLNKYSDKQIPDDWLKE